VATFLQVFPTHITYRRTFSAYFTRAKYPAHRAVDVAARRRSVSALAREPAILTEGFVFLSQYKKYWTVSLLRHGCFLPNTLKLIIHLIPYHRSYIVQLMKCCEMEPHRGHHQSCQHSFGPFKNSEPRASVMILLPAEA
jgi:hypothetical protein